MSAATDPEDARDELEPDDIVGNELCDEILEMADPALVRVLHYHGDWAHSAPSWTDFRRTLERCREIVAVWPADDEHGDDILVRGTQTVGVYERVPVRDGDAVAHTAEVSGDTIETLIGARGAPDLEPLDDHRSQFRDGEHL